MFYGDTEISDIDNNDLFNVYNGINSSVMNNGYHNGGITAVTAEK